MGKKRAAKVVVEEKPEIWCFYCDREFDDEKVLIQHQKAKHFKCDLCHKKLSTAGGLVVHIVQVHKETIKAIPNAKPDRESTEFEVYGMSGIPDEFLSEKARAKRGAIDGPGGPMAPGFPSSLPPRAYGGYQGPSPAGFPVPGMPPQPPSMAGYPPFAGQPQIQPYGMYPGQPSQPGMMHMPPRPPTPGSQMTPMGQPSFNGGFPPSFSGGPPPRFPPPGMQPPPHFQPPPMLQHPQHQQQQQQPPPQYPGNLQI